MEQPNPYTPPQSDVSVPISTEAPLASPWIRLGAQIIDGLCLMAIVLPIQWLSGYYGRVAAMAAEGRSFSFESILWSAVGIAALIAINWKFLQNGQTIGKKVLNLQIRRKDGSRIEPMRIITHRLLVVQVAALIPIVGGIAVLVDSLCIFRAQRNTLHDDIADSKVVVLS